jgi:hypothetical protein
MPIDSVCYQFDLHDISDGRYGGCYIPSRHTTRQEPSAMLRGFWTVLATGFTLAVIGLSMAINFTFGHGLGTSVLNARILGALSVACDGLKALLPLFIAWQWSDGHRMAAAAGTVLFTLLLAYGTASAIGFAAENRTALTTKRDNRNAAHEQATADLAATHARLAALPSHRLSGVIEAEFAAYRKDRLWDRAAACTDATLPASREFCKRIDALKGERTVAAEADRLSAKVEHLKLQIEQARQGGAGREADPQASAISRLTGVDAALVRSGLTWLLALAVEAISAFGLFAITRRRAPAGRASAPEAAGPWRLAASIPDHRRINPAPCWRLSGAG